LLDDKEGVLITSNIKFTCSSLIDNPPAKLAHRKGAPEIDAYRWVTSQEAKKMVMKSQRGLFD